MTARDLLRAQTGVAGLVYIIDADHGVKIGITRWAIIDQRRLEIERTSGMPMHVIRAWQFGRYALAQRVEREAHAALVADRTIGEWFHCHPLQACDVVAEIIRSIAAERLTP